MQQTCRCPRCSGAVAFGARFCANCGTPLQWQQQTQPPPVYQGQQQLRSDERNWFAFHKENFIALAIGLAFIAAGLALFYSGLLVSLGILPLPIIGVLIILFAVYRIIRGQKGD